jgi:hypothetical protein
MAASIPCPEPRFIWRELSVSIAEATAFSVEAHFVLTAALFPLPVPGR